MESRIFSACAVGTLSVLTFSLLGCSITGVDGSSTYACKAPEGVICNSVSGNYYNAQQNNLPSQRRTTAPARPAEPAEGGAVMQPIGLSAAPAASAPQTFSAAPLRSQPRILRLWVKPWEDTDRDLNGESVVLVQVDNGHWLVDRAQRQVREPFAPVKASRKPTTASSGPFPAETPSLGGAAAAPTPSLAQFTKRTAPSAE